jgi:hypothetical protein
VRGCFDCLRHASLLYHRMDPFRENRLPPKTQIDSIFNTNEEKLSNFQRLILFFTKILEICEYRRLGDQCWKQVLNSDMLQTQAWEKVTTIEEFLYKTVTKESCFEQWQYLTNPRDNAKNVVQHLIASNECEFPMLQIDRHKWSYDNGIYDVNTDTFWIFEEQEDWDEQAEAIQTYRRNNGWGQSYTVIPPDGKKMTVKYIPQNFDFVITPETEETFDAREIELPDLESIFKTQKLESETIEWCLIMLARLFFKVAEKDKWQVIFFIKGVAGCGKSTLAKMIRYLYPGDLITTLSANMEKQFGLSGLYKGLICICAEVREDFGLNQADWQSAATGEEVQIAEKHKTAFQHKWDTPMFFLGNEFPDYKDASGSVNRRVLMCEFNHKIANGGDPHLFDKLIQNIHLFHRKAVSLYLEKVRKYGHFDIWSTHPTQDGYLVPKQLYEFKNNMRKSVDCLYSFLENGQFEKDESYSMLLVDFKNMYAGFRRDNNESRIRWSRDHYLATFTELGLVVQMVSFNEDGQTKKKWVIIGLKVKEGMLSSD